MTFAKGHKLATGRPKGSKNIATIAKEERRAIFEEEVSQVFVDKIHQARPEYLLDQFIGKSPDTSVNIHLNADSTDRTQELGNQLVRLFGRGNKPGV